MSSDELANIITFFFFNALFPCWNSAPAATDRHDDRLRVAVAAELEAVRVFVRCDVAQATRPRVDWRVMIGRRHLEHCKLWSAALCCLVSGAKVWQRIQRRGRSLAKDWFISQEQYG